MRKIGVKHPELEAFTILINKVIMAINQEDVKFSPRQQRDLIQLLAGLTRKQMVKLTNELYDTEGADLADSIRRMITSGRGRDRS
ncbi:MAG: hypothetical protein WD512_17355 [Candidatus Paceibacterota bacterium]